MIIPFIGGPLDGTKITVENRPKDSLFADKYNEIEVDQIVNTDQSTILKFEQVEYKLERIVDYGEEYFFYFFSDTDESLIQYLLRGRL